MHRKIDLWEMLMFLTATSPRRRDYTISPLAKSELVARCRTALVFVPSWSAVAEVFKEMFRAAEGLPHWCLVG